VGEGKSKRRRGREMIIEKARHSGAIVISDIVGGYLLTRVYYGHTRREARLLFLAGEGKIRERGGASNE
jgi:hypothetical protein